jgi:hypothetical protein
MSTYTPAPLVEKHIELNEGIFVLQFPSDFVKARELLRCRHWQYCFVYISWGTINLLHKSRVSAETSLHSLRTHLLDQRFFTSTMGVRCISMANTSHVDSGFYSISSRCRKPGTRLELTAASYLVPGTAMPQSWHMARGCPQMMNMFQTKKWHCSQTLRYLLQSVWQN